MSGYRTRARSRNLLFACLAAVAVVACDGGMSGTGIPPIDVENGASMTGGMPENMDGNMDGDTDGESGGGTGRPTDTSTADETPDALENALSVQDGAAVLRLEVALGEAVTLTSGVDGRVLAQRVEERSGDLAVPADAAPLRVGAAERDATFAVFDPVSLVDGSVTTLLVRPAPADSEAVIALPTRTAPTDASLALIRLVAATAFGGDPAATAELRLDGAGGPIDLGTISLDAPATDYTSLAPGSYSLVRDGASGTTPIALRAGDVLTVYLVESEDGIDPVGVRLRFDSGP